MTSNTSSEPNAKEVRSSIAFGRGIDWVIGGLFVVVGVLTALGGYLLKQSVEREWIADAIRDGEFRSDVLTEAEAIDLLIALGEWGTIGLIAVGILFVAVGVGVVFFHGRARKQGGKTPRWILGVVGALVGTLFGFVPFSPVVGGAAAGYLDPDETASGLGTGAIAGLFTMLPVLVWGVFGGIGLFNTIDGELIAPAVVLGGIALIFALIYFVLLSALGGYIGGKLS